MLLLLVFKSRLWHNDNVPLYIYFWDCRRSETHSGRTGEVRPSGGFRGGEDGRGVAVLRHRRRRWGRGGQYDGSSRQGDQDRREDGDHTVEAWGVQGIFLKSVILKLISCNILIICNISILIVLIHSDMVIILGSSPIARHLSPLTAGNWGNTLLPGTTWRSSGETLRAKPGSSSGPKKILSSSFRTLPRLK